MAAYWYFVVYVSPVLLVVVCAYLTWEAFKESRAEDADQEIEGSPGAERSRGEVSRGESWRTDPDAWKDEP